MGTCDVPITIVDIDFVLSLVAWRARFIVVGITSFLAYIRLLRMTASHARQWQGSCLRVLGVTQQLDASTGNAGEASVVASAPSHTAGSHTAVGCTHGHAG
eukprot:6013616-Alexandrium_andersonii.AAC.1